MRKESKHNTKGKHQNTRKREGEERTERKYKNSQKTTKLTNVSNKTFMKMDRI